MFAVPAAGGPLMVAVPLPLSTKLTPVGKAPTSDNAGLGNPEVVTIKLPFVPTVNVVLFALVIVGASFTVKVKACELLPEALLALMVTG